MRIINNKTLVNILSLYGAQAAAALASILTLPILSRSLGAANWGLISAALSLSLTLVAIVEFGFGVSGARTVAVLRDQRESLSELVANIHLIKAFLSIIVIIISYIIYIFVPIFHGHILIYSLAVLFAIVNGFNYYWFFQGIQDVSYYSAVDSLSRVMYAVSIYLLIDSPDDAWKVILISIFFGMVPLILMSFRLYREVDVRFPKLSKCPALLKEAFGLFIFRISVSLYTSANILILGVFVDAKHLAAYASAERLTTIIKGLIIPITQIFPAKISYLLENDVPEARLLIRKVFFGVFVSSMFLLILLEILASFIIKLIYGNEYSESIEIFRYLVLTFPITMLINVLGLQWMIPHKLDRAFNTIMVCAGLLSVALAFFLTPLYGTGGMIASLLTVEAIILTSFYISIIRYGIGFLDRNPKYNIKEIN